MEATDVLIWGGATGQAKVVRPILEYWGHKLSLFVDKDENAQLPFDDVESVVGEAAIEQRLKAGNLPSHFIIAVAANGQVRCNLADKLQALGMQPLTVVHPRAFVAETVEIGAGCQILTMAAISEHAKLGRQTIINTNATVDHDSIVGDGCHIMPGATVTGLVEMENNVIIGSNATILPRLKIGKNTTVGAGAVVTKNIAADQTVTGVPAKPKE